MFQDLTSLVLDIGTYQTRIGYGGDEAPKIVTPSYIAYPSPSPNETQKKILVGKKYLYLDRTNFMIQKIFKQKMDQQSMQIVQDNYWKFVQSLLIDELRVNVKDYSLLFSQDVNLNQSDILKNRQIIANIAFQKLGVSNIFFLKIPVLACFATGRSTALVTDSGDNFTRVTAVHDGFVLNKTLKIVPFAGNMLSSAIQKIIQRKTGKNLQTRYHLKGDKYYPSFLQFHTKQLLTDIKKSFSIGSSQQLAQTSERVSYELPDKSTITFDRNQIPDIFVNPSEDLIKQLSKYEYRGIPNMIADTVNSCDVDIKKQLYSNTLLTGGNILFNGQGLINNILNRVSNLAPPNAKVKSVSITQHAQRECLSWIGGSIVTSLSTFQSYWIGKQEYFSIGSSILQKKCT